MDGNSQGAGEPDDDALFLAVGRAVAAGASLEWSVVELHGTLLHSPRSGSAVAGEGVDRARTGCLDMASQIGDPVEQMVRDAVAPIPDLWQRRNALVHGAWLAGSHLGNPSRSGITIRMGRRGVSTHGWSIESLTSLMEQCGSVVATVSEVSHQLESDPELIALLDREPEPWRIGNPKI